MRVLYISGPSFFDLDLAFVRNLSRQVDLCFLLDLYPKLHRATAVHIRNPITQPGIMPFGVYPELGAYSGFLAPADAYVINRTSDSPLHYSNLVLQHVCWRFVKKHRPDVIHFNNHIYFNHFYLFACPGKKLITIHDPFPHSGDDRDFNRPVARFTRFVNGRLVRNHLLLNRIQLESYRDTYRLSDRNIVTSSLGVYEHLTLFSGAQDCEPCDILFFGRMAPYKGLDVLLDAFVIILREYPECVLTVAGSGDVRVNLSGYGFPSKRLNLLNRYIPTRELASLINRSKIVVCPYKDATQSGVISTAYALCKPVVATRVGGLAEMVEDGVTGVLVRPNDAGSLAGAIVGLLGDEPRRTAMEANIKRLYVDGDRSWAKLCDHMLRIYRELE